MQKLVSRKTAEISELTASLRRAEATLVVQQILNALVSDLVLDKQRAAIAPPTSTTKDISLPDLHKLYQTLLAENERLRKQVQSL